MLSEQAGLPPPNAKPKQKTMLNRIWCLTAAFKYFGRKATLFPAAENMFLLHETGKIPPSEKERFREYCKYGEVGGKRNKSEKVRLKNIVSWFYLTKLWSVPRILLKVRKWKRPTKVSKLLMNWFRRYEYLPQCG